MARQLEETYKDLGQALYFDIAHDSHAVLYELPGGRLNWLWSVPSIYYSFPVFGSAIGLHQCQVCLCHFMSVAIAGPLISFWGSIMAFWQSVAGPCILAKVSARFESEGLG